MLGVLKSSDVAIPNVVKSAKSSSLAPKTQKTEATDELNCIEIFYSLCYDDYFQSHDKKN